VALLRNATQLPIAYRLGAAFLLLLGLLGAIIGLGLNQIELIGKSGRQIAQSSLRQVLLARRAQQAAQAGAEHLYSLFLLDERAQRVPVYASIDADVAARNAALTQLLTRAHGAAGAADAAVVARVQAADAVFRSAFANTVDAVETDRDLARPIMVGRTMPALQAVLGALDDLVRLEERSAGETIAGSEALEHESRQRIVLLGIVAALVALLSGVLITRSIARPLAQTAQLAHDIAAGTLDGPVPSAGNDEVGALVRALDRMRTRIVEREARIADLAYRDGLTGLANRTLFNDRMAQAVATADRTGQPLSVLVLDLDRFKSVNDVLGHTIGDEVLIQVARRLQEEFRRASDTVARIGGDEFAILLPVQNQQEAKAAAARLLRVLEAPVVLDDQSIDVGGSIGIAAFPDDGLTPSELMAHADTAMYVAKQAGSGYAIFDPSMERNPEFGLSLLGDLRCALDEGQLHLAYQPKIVLPERIGISAEVLLRWTHPRRGNVPPDQFIPFAEKTGFIKHLTRWVIAQALRQQAEWRAAGLEIALSINISPRDLSAEQDLAGFVRENLQATGVDPQQICLEVTETAIMSDPSHALASLQALHDMGVRLSIDDYGIGQTSLAYLKDLPVDELKIDRTFVRNLDSDEGDATIVRSTIDLAHNMGLTVVAEGVETESVAGQLCLLGCDEAQGYLFSRPLVADDFRQWAAESAAGAARTTVESRDLIAHLRATPA
jgi:diguanylate cyclase (GGDEF)-like protein